MIFKFAQFELDVHKRELRRGSSVRAVEPQVFALLVFLVENRDRIVTRDEIFEAIWGERIVSESLLGSRINAARRAVDDDGKQQRVIRTSRKNGLRFVATVVEDDGRDASTLRPPTANRAAFDLPGAPSIALLPFSQVDASDRSRFGAATLSEEIGFALCSVAWLRVVTQAPSKLNVFNKGLSHSTRYVLEGSLRTHEDRCVIIVRLNDVRTGVCVWNERYDFQIRNVFREISDTARAIAHAASEHIFAIERIRSRTAPNRERSAWDVVITALSMINTRSKDKVRAAQSMLAALARSGFQSAAVFSLLSFSETLTVHLGWHPRAARRELAYKHVDRALAVDDCDPWAHLALGYAQLYTHNQPDEAIRTLRRAISLDPSLSIAHYLIALSSAYMSDTETAFKEAAIAEKLSSLDLLAKGNVGAHDNVRATTSFVAGRYSDGIQFAERVVALSPRQIPAYRQIVLNAACAGDMGLARAAIAKVRSGAPDVQRWLVDSEPLWSRAEDYRRYVEAFRMAGHGTS